MKNKRLLTGFLLLVPLFLNSQSFQFNIPNTHFMLIPGGGVETKAWVEVPAGDTVFLFAEAGPGMHALFQPHEIYQNQFVYLVVISTDSNLAQYQTIRVVARHLNDSIVHNITIEHQNNGNGFLLIDSAKYFQDTVLQYLTQVWPSQAALLDSLRQLDWIPCFPYPPLWIVTHHLFVSGDWRNTVLWHNMIPPHDWERVFLYNEKMGICFGVEIDTWDTFHTIPCEIMHYNYQDTLTDIPIHKNPEDFSIYPNPTQGFVNIQKGSDAPLSLGLSLFSITGLRILHESWSEPLRTLDLRSVPAGMYILSISDGQRKWQKKIIKY